MIDEFEIEARKHEIKLDWMLFIAECKGKMFEHLDRTYNNVEMKDLVKGMYEEIEEFEQSVKPISNLNILDQEIDDYDEGELCDIANFCMMLWINKKYPR